MLWPSRTNQSIPWTTTRRAFFTPSKPCSCCNLFQMRECDVSHQRCLPQVAQEGAEPGVKWWFAQDARCEWKRASRHDALSLGCLASRICFLCICKKIGCRKDLPRPEMLQSNINEWLDAWNNKKTDTASNQCSNQSTFQHKRSVHHSVSFLRVQRQVFV